MNIFNILNIIKEKFLDFSEFLLKIFISFPIVLFIKVLSFIFYIASLTYVILKNIFIFLYFFFKLILIFCLRVFYVNLVTFYNFLIYIYNNFFFFIFTNVMKIYNYVVLRLKLLKLIILKLDAKQVIFLNSFTFTERVSSLYFSFINANSIFIFFHKTLIYYLYFYLLFYPIFFFNFFLSILFKSFKSAFDYFYFFFKFLKNYLKNELFLNIITFVIQFFKNSYIIFFKLLFHIKLRIFLYINIFKMFIKKNFPFFYGFFLYYKPGYYLAVFYVYFVFVFPYLQIFSYFLLNLYFDPNFSNWSWFGERISFLSVFYDFILEEAIFDLYKNKSVFFFKFGDHADVFFLTISITIVYFLFLFSPFKKVWFDEQNWDISQSEIDLENETPEEENDTSELEDPIEISEGDQNGEEISEYYDDLREKSFIKLRYKNYTYSRGHIFLDDYGWGLFIAFWVITFYYSVKNFFWPQTWIFSGFPGIDFQDTVPYAIPFIENYRNLNLQIYLGWMPGSPLNSSLKYSNWLGWGGSAAEKSYTWSIWNQRYKEGSLDSSLFRGSNLLPIAGLGALNYETFDLHDNLLENTNLDTSGSLFREAYIYTATDVWNEVYDIYPFVYSNLNLWKRSVFSHRDFLNVMYNNGFNFLVYWPHVKNIINPSKFFLIDNFINYKKEVSYSYTTDSLVKMSDYSFLYPNVGLKNFYFDFLINRTDSINFPLTYDLVDRSDELGFDMQFYRGVPEHFLSMEDDDTATTYQVHNVAYDYGLSLFHLHVNNNWWYWLDKPLNEDVIFSTYFKEYMTNLAKKLNNSYERTIFLKLWSQYWDAPFQTGMHYNFYKKLLRLGQIHTDFYDFYKFNIKGSYYMISPREQYLTPIKFHKKMLRLIYDYFPTAHFQLYDIYALEDVGYSGFFLPNKNSLLENMMLKKTDFELYKKNNKHTIFGDYNESVKSVFTFGDVYYDMTDNYGNIEVVSEFYKQKQEGLFIYQENAFEYLKLNKFTYLSSMLNTFLQNYFYNDVRLGFRDLFYDSFLLGNNKNDFIKQDTFRSVFLDKLNFLRYSFSDSKSENLINKFEFSKFISDKIIFSTWFDDCLNYNLEFNDFPYKLPYDFYLNKERFILPKINKIILYNQTLLSYPYINLNYLKFLYKFEFIFKFLNFEVADFYIYLQEIKYNLGFIDFDFGTAYMYDDNLKDASKKMVKSIYEIYNPSFEHFGKKTNSSSKISISPNSFTLTNKLDKNTRVLFALYEPSKVCSDEILDFFMTNRKLCYVFDENFYSVDVNYFFINKTISYDILYNLYLNKVGSVSNFVQLSDILFLDKTLLASINFSKTEVSKTESVLRLKQYINDYWKNDILLWYLMTYDLRFLDNIKDFDHELITFINKQ